jgi:3-dehydroquinate synthetase
MSEIVKHGLLADSDLFEKLESGDWSKRSVFSSSPAIQTLVAQAIQVKISIVQEDPFEHGKRSVLNLGHTFAHAIEQVSGHVIRHGEAVAIGLVAAINLSVRLGYCHPAVQERVEVVCRKIGLPTRIPGELLPEMILKAMGNDKKRLAESLRIVLLRSIGQPLVVNTVLDQEILDTLQELANS